MLQIKTVFVLNFFPKPASSVVVLCESLPSAFYKGSFHCVYSVYHLVAWSGVKVLVVQSCLTLFDPKDYRSPGSGSSVHGIL